MKLNWRGRHAVLTLPVTGTMFDVQISGEEGLAYLRHYPGQPTLIARGPYELVRAAIEEWAQGMVNEDRAKEAARRLGGQ